MVEAPLAESAETVAPVRRIRVLHVITSLERGGAENHLLALLTHADHATFEFETAVQGVKATEKIDIEKVAVNPALDDALFAKLH